MPRVHDLNRLISRLETDLGITLDAAQLDNRIQIQKLLYFAQEFGADFGYDYNMYIHGPYSPALARDYYDGEFREVEGNIPGNLDYANFLDNIEGKSNTWLALASTIHKLYGSYQMRYTGDELVEEVINAAANKKNASPDRAFSVFEQLNEEGLLS